MRTANHEGLHQKRRSGVSCVNNSVQFCVSDKHVLDRVIATNGVFSL